MLETEKEKDSKLLTVSQLTGLIKNLMEGTFPNIYLEGEISNYRPNISGHLYFVLKDSMSQIRAVMFRGKAASLNFTPTDGTLVMVQGQISVYQPRGEYQIIINKMAKAGAGDIMEMIEERKKRLAAEGIFSKPKKRLPYFPETIGIVTSPTGAALRDILNIVKRRNNKVNVIVFPALVQGSDAAQSIIKMIKIANKYKMCDLLIVGRGGGSLEDLLPFSDEELVREIAASELPIISAVGHEIDSPLCDYAADVRAPTPSAAAELAVPQIVDFEQTLNAFESDLYNSIQFKLKNLSLMLNQFKPEGMMVRLQNIKAPYIMRFDLAKEALFRNISDLIEAKKQKIRLCTADLNNCNPQVIFNRGYSMVCNKDGKVIRNAADLEKGEKIIIRPSSGKIIAQVEEVEK